MMLLPPPPLPKRVGAIVVVPKRVCKDCWPPQVACVVPFHPWTPLMSLQPHHNTLTHLYSTTGGTTLDRRCASTADRAHCKSERCLSCGVVKGAWLMAEFTVGPTVWCGQTVHSEWQGSWMVNGRVRWLMAEFMVGDADPDRPATISVTPKPRELVGGDESPNPNPNPNPNQGVRGAGTRAGENKERHALEREARCCRGTYAGFNPGRGWLHTSNLDHTTDRFVCVCVCVCVCV
jgi:hypothetical protein